MHPESQVRLELWLFRGSRRGPAFSRLREVGRVGNLVLFSTVRGSFVKMRDQIANWYEEFLFRTPSQSEVESWIAIVRDGILHSPERQSKVTQFKGFAVAVTPGDQESLAIHAQQSAFSFNLLLQQLERGDVVVDLGAHLGTFSIQAAARGAIVLAVEAGCENVRYLSATARMNPQLDVRVFHCAAWFEEASLGFAENGTWGVVDSRSETKIRAAAVDDLLDDLITRVSCVKIDVEGSEPEALMGMARLLEREVDVLYESNSHTLAMLGHDIRECVAMLTKKGYDNYLIHEGALYQIEKDFTQPTTVADCLATRRDPRRLGVPVYKAMSDAQMSFEMLRLLELPESRAHVARELRIHPHLGTPELIRAL